MKLLNIILTLLSLLPNILLLSLIVAGEPVLAQKYSDIKQRVSFTSYLSSGDYGEDADTDILYFPVSYSVKKGKWIAQFAVPHLQVQGAGNVLVDIGGVTRAVAGNKQESNGGVGDSTLALIYQMDQLSDTGPFIDFRLDVKIPTADRKKGLGTGEADYGIQVDISQSYGGSVLFGSLGYTFRGKTDLYAGLEDSAYVQLGVAKPFATQWNVGVFYDFRESASTFSSEIRELVPYFSYQISESWVFTGLAAFGFTEAGAGTAFLGQLSYSL